VGSRNLPEEEKKILEPGAKGARRKREAPVVQADSTAKQRSNKKSMAAAKRREVEKKKRQGDCGEPREVYVINKKYKETVQPRKRWDMRKEDKRSTVQKKRRNQGAGP